MGKQKHVWAHLERKQMYEVRTQQTNLHNVVVFCFFFAFWGIVLFSMVCVLNTSLRDTCRQVTTMMKI